MLNKLLFRVVLASLLMQGCVRVNAQITLTGCHLESGTEYCFLPNGEETAIITGTTPAITGPQASSTGPITASPTAPTSVAAETTATAQTTAITDCHDHGTTQYCVKGDGEEVQVLATATGSDALPTAYTGCHAHGTEMFCLAPDGSEVEVVGAAATAESGDTVSEEPAEEGGENCHFHAGVEHCVGSEGEESATNCERRDRDYNVGLRIGLIFPILITSALAVYAPLIMRRLLKMDVSGLVFTIIKQFGTGIIIATGFVHLLTHAELMFGNSCLGELKYEATTTAIAMAGAFIAFLIEYGGHRLAHWRQGLMKSQSSNSSLGEGATSTLPPGDSKKEAAPVENLATLSHHHSHHATSPTDTISVLVLEAGIIFHSLLLGITLVVAGDSVFITLYIVILFHQCFEGLALGARIAATASNKTTTWILPMAFALVTATGMAIGIGVLNQFNGNDPSTIVALGTLDALSAGILLWVGLVSMWANDWIYGELKSAPLVKTVVAFFSLVSGLLLMSVLGKWA
ncbi:ZIP zinc transporter [Phlyctema vagabunda]|uniref:ZIP zinc transporter n=1 Tax=Phlyctema vagabunda TaxID=108571 RepID=A0ABR4PNY4_9HELO